MFQLLFNFRCKTKIPLLIQNISTKMFNNVFNYIYFHPNHYIFIKLFQFRTGYLDHDSKCKQQTNIISLSVTLIYHKRENHNKKKDDFLIVFNDNHKFQWYTIFIFRFAFHDSFKCFFLNQSFNVKYNQWFFALQNISFLWKEEFLFFFFINSFSTKSFIWFVLD